MPGGSDPVLVDEPVDNFLTLSDLSDELDQPGTWTLCGYLSNSRNTTMASTEVSFAVSGPAVNESEGEAGSSATPLTGADTGACHPHQVTHTSQEDKRPTTSAQTPLTGTLSLRWSLL